MLCKKKMSFTIVLCFAVVVFLCVLCASFSNSKQVGYAEEVESSTYYWAAFDEELIISSNQSDTQGDGVTDSGTFLSDVEYRFNNIPWMAHRDSTNVKILGNVTPISTNWWFKDFAYLTEIDVTGLNTSNVSGMTDMFSFCRSLRKIDLSSFDLSNVYDMISMFSGCVSLEEVKFASSNNLPKLEDIHFMFEMCGRLKTIEWAFNTSNALCNVSGAFVGCSSLEYLDLSGFDFSNVDDTYNLIDDCTSLKSLIAPKAIGNAPISLPMNGTSTMHFRAGEEIITEITNEYAGQTLTRDDIFWGVTDNYELIISDNIHDLAGIYDTERKGNFPFDTQFAREDNVSYTPWRKFFYNTNEVMEKYITSAKVVGNVAPLYLDEWFAFGYEVERIDLSGLDTGQTVSMANMFYNCDTITSLDFSHFDTSKVTNMRGMFRGCLAFTQFDLSDLDMSKVVNMNSMFESDFRTESIIFPSNCAISSVSDVSAMFAGCESLKELDLSSFDMTNVVSIDYTFFSCDSLKQLRTPKAMGETTIELPSTFWNGYNDIQILNSDEENKPLVVHNAHISQKRDAKDATCVEDGNIEYYACSICGKYFQDELCQSEITNKGEVIIDALGHLFDTAPTYSWDGAQCTAERVCSRDNHKESESVTASVSSTATCAQDGQDVYTATFENSAFTTQIKSEERDALGHDFGEWTVTKQATVDEFGEEQRVCQRDGAHIETRQIPKLEPEPEPGDTTPSGDINSGDVTTPDKKPTQEPENEELIWIILSAVMAVVIICEICYLIAHKVRKDKSKENK
ncbi:MAG: DUF285 domain-containing protein [Clostridia bacterium]|nr:DUF285 domain-containing protein [Clostridia bacterium]